MMGTDQAPAPPSPYRGILPFRYADRDLFFGREREINDLAAKILLYRLVVVFGESGVGKSSLLNAGIIPALQRERFQAERLRARPFAEEPILVERVRVAEGGGLLPSIFAAESEVEDRDEQGVARSLEEFQAAVKAPAHGLQPVLIFDQFEELFTLFEPGHWGLQTSLLDAIYQMINSRELIAKVVIVIREDFVGKLEVLAKQYPQVFEQRVRLGQLSPTAARKAILGAFREGHFYTSEITPQLADLIVHDLTGGDEHASIQSTQLQIVCSRLWDRFATAQASITPDDYRAFGGVHGILAGFLRSEIDKLAPDDRDLAYLLMGQMVTDLGTRDVVSADRIRRAVGDNSRWQQQAFAATGTLRLLEELRLINRTPQRGTYYYEVTSEYLIAPILAWNQARERAEAEWRAAEEAREKAEQTTQARELEQARLLAAEQQRRADSEARSARRLRIALVVSLASLFAVTALAIFAASQRSIAELAKLEAVKASQKVRDALKEREKGLQLFQLNVKLKQDALSGDFSRLMWALKESPTEVLFKVTATSRGYKNPAGQPVYAFEMYPQPDTVRGGLSSIALVTYKLNHPSFRNSVLAGGPDREFRASYNGWGALDRVIVVIEYNDPDRKVEVTTFNMQEILGWKKSSS
ncbi:MAG: ATP-binding protein [Gammaproteobacteria bacterium]